VKVALLVEPDLACGDLMDVLLREASVLAVQVTSVPEALCLLNAIGFDLVMADSSIAANKLDGDARGSAIRAAACDHVILLRRPDAPAELPQRSLGFQLALSKPFSEREFGAILSYVGLAGVEALPRSG
jgi:DNA-binding response OmpR family regulator